MADESGELTDPSVGSQSAMNTKKSLRFKGSSCQGQFILNAVFRNHFFVPFPESDEMKKRMYSCVIVVGGGFMYNDAESWLQYRIWSQMPARYRSQLETMDVLTKAKVSMMVRAVVYIVPCCWVKGKSN